MFLDVFIVCGRYVELCDRLRGIFMAALTVPFMRYELFLLDYLCVVLTVFFLRIFSTQLFV